MRQVNTWYSSDNTPQFLQHIAACWWKRKYGVYFNMNHGWPSAWVKYMGVCITWVGGGVGGCFVMLYLLCKQVWRVFCKLKDTLKILLMIAKVPSPNLQSLGEPSLLSDLVSHWAAWLGFACGQLATRCFCVVIHPQREKWPTSCFLTH